MEPVEMSGAAVGAEGRGYNRGLILGFTMAESLLLVVFCLLLVAAAIISKERERAQIAERKVEQAARETTVKENEIATLQKRVETLTGYLGSANNEKTDEDWRELVITKTAFEDLKKLFPETPVDQVAREVETIVSENRDLKATVSELRKLEAELAASKDELIATKALLDERDARLAALEGGGKPHEWPPIITLSEANKNFFQSGSAELTTAFSDKLSTSISKEIADNLAAYGADIVEVIGHTDEQPLSRPKSNMDGNSIAVLSAQKPVSALEPADNAGLGLARAISVANVLKSNAALDGVTVLPLSAAQLILPGDLLTTGEAGNVESRRRIEIRIRRRDAVGE
jgi:flagellar motor protein MotB